MRQALLALALLTATGCGVMPRQAQRPATDVHWPAVAEATRQQWYRGVERAASEPVTLSEADLEAALQKAAASAGVILVRTHYLPLLGGTAELVVQPQEPVEFAEVKAPTGITTLLGPLGHDQRPYFVTVVNAEQEPLLMLGWTPHLGGNGGQGVGWQAPGISSDAIVGQPVIRPALVNDPEARLRHD